MLSPPGGNPSGGRQSGPPGGSGGGQGGRNNRQVADEMVQDPECKVYVPLSRAVSRNIGGRTVHFCSEDCAEKHVKGSRG